MTQIANNLDTSIYEIPEIIEKRKLEVAELVEQISSTTRKISRLELDCETTKKDFKEYEKTRPLTDRIKHLECELKERDRIMICKRKIQGIKLSLIGKKNFDRTKKPRNPHSVVTI